MATYKGRTVRIERSAGEIVDKFADLSRFKDNLDALPEEERAKIGDIEFASDSITLNTPQVGQIRFEVAERSPRRILMRAAGSPVPLTMGVDLDPKSADSTDVTTSVEVDIPMMLRPMVGPHLQKAVDQFSDLVAKLAR